MLEVLVVLGIMLTLCSVGLPSLGLFTDNHTTRNQGEEFLNALRLARHEAVRWGEAVTLCPRDASQGDLSTDCANNSRDWSGGWVVFVDRGQRGSQDEGDTVIWVYQSSRVVGRVESSARSLTFQPLGVSFNAAANFHFLPASAQAGDYTAPGHQLICVNKPGRPRWVTGTSCS